MVGGLLSIKPVVAVRNGEVVVLGKARGSKNGSNHRHQSGCGEDGLCLFAGERRLPHALSGSAGPLYPGGAAPHVDHLPIDTVGGTIGTHVGPGAIAVAFFQKR